MPYKFFATAVMGLLVSVGLPSTSAAKIKTTDAKEVIEVTEHGTINWTTRRIEATGCAETDQSVFKQKIAAETMARANLLKVLKAVHIDSERLVRDGMTKGIISMEKVKGLLAHSRVTKPRTNELGLMEVIAYIYLDKNGNAVLIPEESGDTESTPAISSGKMDMPDQAYTGLIIDARHLSVKPAMLPQLYVEGSDRELLRTNVSRDYVLANGVCGYAGSMEKAKATTDRVGENPLVVKAAGVAESGMDLYVSEANAVKMRYANQENSIIDECRVMIVVR